MAKSVKDIPVLFENEHCMVLGKPAGLSVQGGEGVGVSLDSLLSESFSPRPLLVHRLDKDTSGVILVAKSREAAAFFSGLFAASPEGQASGRTVVKRYLALCSGIPEQKTGLIEIALDVRAKGRTPVQRKARTFFRLLPSHGEGAAGHDAVPGEDAFSLLELELGTGRMHQIRRHLAGIGHPVLGDDKYGDFSLNKKLRKERGLKNLLLHAASLIIPPSKFLPEGLKADAPLPVYFSAFLGR